MKRMVDLPPAERRNLVAEGKPSGAVLLLPVSALHRHGATCIPHRISFGEGFGTLRVIGPSEFSLHLRCEWVTP